MKTKYWPKPACRTEFDTVKFHQLYSLHLNGGMGEIEKSCPKVTRLFI